MDEAKFIRKYTDLFESLGARVDFEMFRELKRIDPRPKFGAAYFEDHEWGNFIALFMDAEAYVILFVTGPSFTADSVPAEFLREIERINHERREMRWMDERDLGRESNSEKRAFSCVKYLLHEVADVEQMTHIIPIMAASALNLRESYPEAEGDYSS
jgi:hypothetical protein